MKKVFDLGKIDYNNKGRKINLVTVEMEYTAGSDEKKRFSVCGNIWNSAHTDLIHGGQCLDTIAQYVKTPLFQEIYRLWNLYHLNDMHPECAHQAELGWREQAREPINEYIFTLNTDIYSQHAKIKEKALKKLCSGETVKLAPSEQAILTLKYQITSANETLPKTIAKFYTLTKKQTKCRGQIFYSEDKNGILCKPCPVCGYKYGSAWNYFPIPEADEQIIYKLLKGEYEE